MNVTRQCKSTQLKFCSRWGRCNTSLKAVLLAATMAVTGLASGVNAASLTPSGPIVINGENGTVISGLKIWSTVGDCVQIINSTNITIKNSEIGPCGTSGTTANSRGVFISGSSAVGVYDNYIHVENLASGCCDTHVGVLTANSSTVTVQGNVIAYGETNIEAQAGTDSIVVRGNFLLNPRGPFPRGQQFQASYARNILVENNYAMSATTGYSYPENQEDAINFWRSNTFTARNNYIVGGHSPSGCGLLIDDQSNYGKFLGNILANTGQCGIGITDGVGHVVDGNKVLNLTPITGAGNTAIYLWKQYFSNALGCGGNASPNQITVSNNVADEIKTDNLTHSGWWNGGGCDVVSLSNNMWNENAYRALYPIASKYPPPLIPPQPFGCVAVSPYSTQTSVPSCVPVQVASKKNHK